jgi:GRF zinc finger
MTDYHPCPKCSEECAVRIVKKETENHNRPFISCSECETFCWLDQGYCKRCSKPLVVRTVKKESRNHGRKFRACPGNCAASFKWVD